MSDVLQRTIIRTSSSMVSAIDADVQRFQSMTSEMSDNRKREAEFVIEWVGKSRRPGDHFWKMVNGWSGLGDYIPGADDGEPPAKAIW